MGEQRGGGAGVGGRRGGRRGEGPDGGEAGWTGWGGEWGTFLPAPLPSPWRTHYSVFAGGEKTDPATKGRGLPFWAHCRVPRSLGEKRQPVSRVQGGRTRLSLEGAGEGTGSGRHTTHVHTDIKAGGEVHGALRTEAAFHQQGAVLRAAAGAGRCREPGLRVAGGQHTGAALAGQGSPPLPCTLPRLTWTCRWAPVQAHRPGTPCGAGTPVLWGGPESGGSQEGGACASTPPATSHPRK